MTGRCSQQPDLRRKWMRSFTLSNYLNKIEILIQFKTLARLVSLTRQSLNTRKLEERELRAKDGRDPDLTFKNPSSSKGGVFETFIRVQNLT